MREAKREHLKYKTIGYSYTLKQAQEFDEMFYFIVNERNRLGKEKQKYLSKEIIDAGGVAPNLRSLVKTNNQVLFDIIKEEYDRQKGRR